MTDAVRELLDPRCWSREGRAEIVRRTRPLDPATLGEALDYLADPAHDDALRRRLALAARCLATRPVEGELFRAHLDRLTTEVVAAWWQHFHAGAGRLARHLLRALGRLALLGGCIREIPLGQWLLDCLDREDGSPRAAVAILPHV